MHFRERSLRIFISTSLSVICFSWEITNATQLTIASTGTNVTFTCNGLTAENTVNNETMVEAFRWEIKRIGKDATFSTIFANGRLFSSTHCLGCSASTSAYNNETASVDTNFTIINVGVSHAGEFRCSSSLNVKKTSRDFELVVLVSEPMCRINESAFTSQQLIRMNEFDMVTVKCNVSYAGSWLPVFECQPEFVEMSSFTNSSSSHGLVEYVSTAEVTQSFNQRSIKCGMHFLRTGLSVVNTSVPDKPRFEWTSPIVNVLYGFKGGNVTQNDTILNCRVDSNPEPSIHWVYYISNDNNSISSVSDNHSDINFPVFISNKSVITVCDIYSSFQPTPSNETQPKYTVLECIAYFHQPETVGRKVFETDFFEQMLADKCPESSSPDDPSQGTSTMENTEPVNDSVVSRGERTDEEKQRKEQPSKPRVLDSIPLSWVLGFVLPLVGILLISFIIITVLICKVKSRRRLSTKKKKKESSARKSVSFRERISGAYDDIYDLPEDKAAAQYERQTGGASDGYNNLYDETREPPSSSAGYDSINSPPSESTNSTNQTVNESGQPGATRPYLSVVADDEIVEYAISKTYYDEKHRIDTHVTVQTNPYNKLEAKATDYMVPTASANYTSVKSPCDSTDRSNLSLPVLDEISPCEADEAPIYAVVNKKGFHEQGPFARTPGSFCDDKKDCMPSKSSQSSQEGEIESSLHSLFVDDSNSDDYKHDSATVTAVNKPSETKVYLPLSSSLKDNAMVDNAQIYTQIKKTQGYHKLTPATLNHQLADAKTYVPLDATELTAERDGTCVRSEVNFNGGYNTLTARAIEVELEQSAKVYVPLLHSSQISSPEMADEPLNDLRVSRNNGYHKLDPNTLESQSSQIIVVKDYSPLVFERNDSEL